MTLSRLPILMYHGIHSHHTERGIFNPRYSVGVDEFCRQLDWLAASGMRTTLLGAPGKTAENIVLTFDDGDVTSATVALPLLTERGMVGEFCVTSGNVGQPDMVTRAQIREIANHGMGVQAHGRTHRPLAALPEAELHEELATSRRCLQEWSDQPVDAVSLPGGRGGAREYRAARAAGYRYVLNSVPGPNLRRRPDGPLHRIAVTRGMPLGEFDQLVRWQGLAPWLLTIRTAALEVPKRVLGESRYGRLRTAARFR